MSHGFLIAMVTATCVVAFAPQSMAQFGGFGGPGVGAPPGGGGTARTTTVKSSKSNTSDRMGGGGGKSKGLTRMGGGGGGKAATARMGGGGGAKAGGVARTKIKSTRSNTSD